MKPSDVIKPGAKFGRWTVLKINVTNPNSKAKKPPKCALCQCECGTQRYKEYRDLYSGRSLSCGCLKADQLRERNKNNSSVQIGNQYGYLVVEEDLGFRTQSRGKQESWYRCSCLNCGNHNFETNGNNLTSGNTISCGCIISKGEHKIKQLLLQHNINFVTQYKFKDLVSNTGYPLAFDFAIIENNQLAYLIEFDGRQHYDTINSWANSDLQSIQYRDELKNQYCKQHNIALIRIPYTHYDQLSIEDLLLNTTTFLME